MVYTLGLITDISVFWLCKDYFNVKCAVFSKSVHNIKIALSTIEHMRTYL